MSTKRIVLLGILVLLVAVTGCVPEVTRIDATRIRVGELVTESESVELGGARSVRAEIFMGGGELSVAGGADELLEADFTYNVAELEPEVKYGGGKLIVQHPDVKFEGLGSLWDLDGYRCQWDLRLNDDVPLEVSITVGTGTAHLEMGSLSLTRLDVATGTGDVTVDVSGAASLTRLGLQMGAGNVTVDLSGTWEHEVDVDLEGIFGELTVWLPRDAGVRVGVEGALGKVNVIGLTKEGDDYVNDAHGESEVVLRIDITGGVGQVTLEVRE